MPLIEDAVITTTQKATQITGLRLESDSCRKEFEDRMKQRFLKGVDALAADIVKYINQKLPNPESRHGKAVIYHRPMEPINASVVGDEECAHELLQALQRDDRMPDICGVSIEDLADALVACEGWVCSSPSVACVVVVF